MKFSQIHVLKEIVLADKRKFTAKEYSKKLFYEAFKENILDRIEKIEQSKMKEARYCRDIDKHMARMKKKLGIDFKELLELAGTGQPPPPAESKAPEPGKKETIIPK